MNAQIDVTDIRIETPRLVLRPWRQGDSEDLYAYAKEYDVGHMAGWCSHKSLEESQEIVKIFISGKKTLALESKETGRVIGSVGIEPVASQKMTASPLCGREIGFALSKDEWGKGLMPEAVKAVIDYCFSVLHYDFLMCGHFVWNRQSQRVIEKCGFEYTETIEWQTRYETIEPTREYILYNKKDGQ